MESRDVLIDAYTSIQEVAHASAEGLDTEGLAYRPEADANSIAWLVWHLTRSQDSQVAPIAGAEQAWSTGDWAEKLGLDPALSNTGYGYTSEQVAAVRPDGPEAGPIPELGPQGNPPPDIRPNPCETSPCGPPRRSQS